MKTNKGFTVIEGLLILVILGILGSTGWYVWDSQHKTTDAFNNADAANSSVAKYSKATVAQTQSKQYLTVNEWGVKVPIDNSTEGLSYKIGNDGVASFSDSKLKGISGSCTSNLETVARGTANDSVPNELGTNQGETFSADYQANLKNKNQNTRGVAVYIGVYYYVPPSYPAASCAAVNQTSQSEETDDLLNIVKAVNGMIAI